MKIEYKFIDSNEWHVCLYAWWSGVLAEPISKHLQHRLVSNDGSVVDTHGNPEGDLG